MSGEGDGRNGGDSPSGDADERVVCVVTGTRAEYGLLRSSMEAIRGTEGLALRTIATGMHLSPDHGNTVEEIRADGFEVTETVHMLVAGDTGLSMAKSLGIGTEGIAEALGSIDPDVVLVLGDRDEALAGGLAAAHMNVPVAHVHGGDSMHGAIIDDSIRHALTKFAHLHFPVSELSADRIRKLGEEEWRITTVGAPGLDAVLDGEYADPDEVVSKYDLGGSEPLALVVQHPVTTVPDEAGDQMRATLEAVTDAGVRPVVVYPNSDAGGRQMIAVVDEYAAAGRVETFKSLPRAEYLGLLAAADVMVGNSSSGIIEAPSFDLPVVDVGPRQEGRERADNTLSVAHDRAEIREAIDRALEDESVRRRAAECDNPYDYGGAGRRVAERLASVELGEDLLRKRLTY
ncbi:UDP-N-acetylglucosamine 2-epimerase [Halorussus salinisoli]|uniref:UDP-N-acetylglucosamine 2-epimerase n=1 Tax=Halorussus salinisoli TaxID=2558242 RepID=UPI0010C1C330|nr:UDP-N-acetylglucosamine 2-epimerase [Halorussus salinisoli]